MALKHFKIKEIKQVNKGTSLSEITIKFLDSQAPISGKELFSDTQELIGLIEEAKKMRVKVDVII